MPYAGCGDNHSLMTPQGSGMRVNAFSGNHLTLTYQTASASAYPVSINQNFRDRSKAFIDDCYFPAGNWPAGNLRGSAEGLPPGVAFTSARRVSRPRLGCRNYTVGHRPYVTRPPRPMKAAAAAVNPIKLNVIRWTSGCNQAGKRSSRRRS